jgi:IS1 family transposase/transposase-like protein
MAITLITCPKCYSRKINKNGKTKNTKQKYLCKNCGRQFVSEYSYNGYKKQLTDLIMPMTMNGSGIRDISRVLKISTNTVIKRIKECIGTVFIEPNNLATSPSNSLEKVELDEMWSFVYQKSNQQWLWYGFDRLNKKILAFVIGKRTDNSCQQLLNKLNIYSIDKFCSDNWESYSKFIEPDKHIISKLELQNIERNNLNFRTHIKRLQRKTICFSKSEQMHYGIINYYINYRNHKL